MRACGLFDETDWIRRNRMARASVDCALRELYAKELGLPYYRYSNDIPGSDRYYYDDIVTPSIFVAEHALMHIPDRSGTGFELNAEVVEKNRLEKWEFTK